MRETLEMFCVRTRQLALLDEWDTVRNETLTSKDVSYGSKRKVWWHCQKGHVWQAAVHTRTSSGADCPYCAGKRAWPGETDLGTLYPDLAAQWHPEKNEALTPAAVLPGSHRKVWWVCEAGHTWQAQVKSRVAGCGCPVCANREISPGDNDLAASHPELAAQWHPAKNGALTPRDVVAGTQRKVWWVCERGHEWQASVASRAVGGVGCPACAGKVIIPGENDLATLFPAVAAQWLESRNGKCTPSSVSPYSNRRVWWRCELGHTWQAAVASRTQACSDCPTCAGRKVLAGFNDLATTEPMIAAQWHPTLNGALTPEMVTAGSHQKVWWQCPVGHVWKAVIYSRAGPQRNGCPACAGMVGGKRRRRYEDLLAEGPWPASGLSPPGGL